MNTARWLTNRTPRLMLRLIGVDYRETVERKFRLFSVACWRRVLDLLVDDRLKALVEAQEAFADGTIDEPTLTAIRDEAAAVGGIPDNVRSIGPARERSFWVARFGVSFDPDSMSFAASGIAGSRASQTNGMTREDPDDSEAVRLATRTEARLHSDLLREIFDNPFRPSAIDPAWLTWEGGTVPKLAKAIYQGKDFDRLPIFGDALEEAGCSDPAILDHCRREGGHVRGCWVLDSLLGRR
jgi:hypothetical protein